MNVRYIEKVAKGFANHHRINILLALKREQGLTLLDISDKLKLNFRTASEHSKKLVVAGLIEKKYRGQAVQHRLTNRGDQVLRFCRMIK